MGGWVGGWAGGDGVGGGGGAHPVVVLCLATARWCVCKPAMTCNQVAQHGHGAALHDRVETTLGLVLAALQGSVAQRWPAAASRRHLPAPVLACPGNPFDPGPLTLSVCASRGVPSCSSDSATSAAWTAWLWSCTPANRRATRASQAEQCESVSPCALPAQHARLLCSRQTIKQCELCSRPTEAECAVGAQLSRR